MVDGRMPGRNPSLHGAAGVQGGVDRALRVAQSRASPELTIRACSRFTTSAAASSTGEHQPERDIAGQRGRAATRRARRSGLRVALDFPTLDIHVAHAAWPWVMEMIGVAFTCPRVWVSPDQYMIEQIPGADEYVKAANNYFADRTLFGTAYPAKPLAEMVTAYRRWPWGPGVQEKVLGTNALPAHAYGLRARVDLRRRPQRKARRASLPRSR